MRAEFAYHLSSDDIRMRFASPHFSVHYFLPGFEGRTFAAVDDNGKILGLANLAALAGDAVELAIIVRSDRRRLGIGNALITHAIRVAQQSDRSELIGFVQAENSPMLALARDMGFHCERHDSFFCEVRWSLVEREHL